MLRLALLGHPVAHSRSPEVHAAFGRQLGIPLHYALIDVAPSGDGDELERALTAFVAAGGRGVNLTLPFKQRALALATRLTPRAAAAGAVNALRIEDDGTITGDDTDGAGLLRDLARRGGIALAGTRVALLGGGGAARGVAAALLAAGAEVTLAVRDPAQGAALARAFPAATVGGYPALAGGGYALLVNATSASLRDELPPLPDGVLASGGVAVDLAYADAPTRFLRWAAAAGAGRAIDGWGMLVEQAALCFESWTGRRPDTGALHARRA